MRTTHVLYRVFVAITLLTGCAYASAWVVRGMQIGGHFSDSDGNIYGLPLITIVAIQNYTYTLEFGGQPVEFNVRPIGTEDLGGGRFSDVVRIEYLSLSGTPFQRNEAYLGFIGRTSTGHMVPADDVISYSEADSSSPGWIWDATDLPSLVVGFHTQQDGALGTNGAPDSAYFELNYTYHLPGVPLPAALPLLTSGIGVLGALGWRKTRKTFDAEDWDRP